MSMPKRNFAKEQKSGKVKQSEKQKLSSDWINQESTMAGKSPNQQKSEFMRYTSDEFQKCISLGNQDNYVNKFLKKLEEMLLSEQKRMKNEKLYLEKRRLFSVLN